MENPEILLDAFKLKPAAAVDYMKRKGYAFSWNWFDLWKDAHAKAFTVAKVTKVELLRDIRNMVEKAVSDGITLQQFKKELTPKLQKQGWWGKKEKTNEETGEITEYMMGSPRRLKTIYQTNLQTAYMAGRYKGQMDAAADLPYLQYIAVMDGKTTDACRDMHGRIFRADDPIWNEFYPPNHWGCRSRVRSLSDRQLQRAGVEPESSAGRIVEREVTVGKGENARTAKVSGLKLESGGVYWTGAGWNYNPGSSTWMPDLSSYSPGDARAFVEDNFRGPAYKFFIEAQGKIRGSIPIAVLPKEYMDGIGARTNIVELSSDTLAKNAEHHKEITAQDYLNSQTIIEKAQVIVQDGPRTMVFIQMNDKWYHAAIKATRTGKGLFMTSLRITQVKDVERFKLAGKVIKE